MDGKVKEDEAGSDGDRVERKDGGSLSASMH